MYVFDTTPTINKNNKTLMWDSYLLLPTLIQARWVCSNANILRTNITLKYLHQTYYWCS